MASEDTSPFSDSLYETGGAAGAAKQPSQIGPYRITRVLGEGGMGTVYEAEQLEPVRRRVAVKLVKLGMDTRDVIARFGAERQALALMNHPNIAQVFEAGATPAGRPYFVMELVEGVPLTSYCDAHTLQTNRRLELFAQVCDAVQHAHSKGIIHRDLKPGNVLVTEVDGRAVPKVIDFGIAKAIDQHAAERTLFTEMGRMVGTPEYMSPEQAGARPSADVDTRTDVYSLGVMLYELLTGTLPFEARTLRALAYAEVQRIICEVEPPRPSTRVSSVPAADAVPLARQRRETVASLAGELRRELEWIPLKALRKDREHRYRTASELADDVRNYLAGRPLMAGPETRSYQAMKFLRRHRAAVAVAAAVLALLIGGIATTTWQAARATRAEHIARSEKADADIQRAAAQRRFDDVRGLSSRMLFDLLPDVDRLPGSTTATRKLVDMSREYLSNLQAEASKDLGLMRDVAKAYNYLGNAQGNPVKRNLGDMPAALQSFDRAAALARQALAIAPDDADALDALGASDLNSGEVLDRQGRREEALTRFARAKASFARAKTLRPDSAGIASHAIVTTQHLAQGRLTQGDLAAGTDMLREALADAKALAARFPDDRDVRLAVAVALDQYANAQSRGGKYADAAGTLREEVAMLEAALASFPDDAGFRGALSNASFSLAWTLCNQDADPAEANEPLTRAVELGERAYAIDPTDASALAGLSHSLILQQQVLAGLRRDEDGEKALDRAIELIQRGLTSNPSDRSLRQDLIVAYGASANIHQHRGDLAGALHANDLSAQTLAPMIAADPQNALLQSGLAFTRWQMAHTRVAMKEFAAAAVDARTACEIDERVLAAAPEDVRTERNLLSMLNTRATALLGVVNDPTTAEAQRAAARAEGRTVLRRIAEVADHLVTRNALTPESAAEYKESSEAERAFSDDPASRPAATKPATS